MQIAEADASFAQLGGRSLSATVAWYLANYKAPVTDKPLADAQAAFIADRTPHVRAPALRDYEGTLSAFVEALPERSVSSVDALGRC